MKLEPIEDEGYGALPPALLASPRSPDSAILQAALTECGIPTRVVEGPQALEVAPESIGSLVLTQEAFTPELRAAVATLLDQQPSWSQLPVVVILEHRGPGIAWQEVLLEQWNRANVTFLVRPLSGLEVQSAVQLATSARMRQFRIRDQLDQERELRRELNHRVKNILATVQAIAKMTERTAQGSDPFRQFSERLAALGRVHGALDRVSHDGETFKGLVQTVLQPYLSEGEQRFTIAGPDTPLTGTAASMLGLCLFELATNAMKHGALSVDDGHVLIELARCEDGASFRWQESGGPEVRTPTRRGYGTRFLSSTLASVFGGEAKFDYAAEGFGLSARGRAAKLFREEKFIVS